MDGKNLEHTRREGQRRGTYSRRWRRRRRQCSLAAGRRPQRATLLRRLAEVNRQGVPCPALLARALARTHCCRVEKACQTTAAATTMDART